MSKLLKTMRLWFFFCLFTFPLFLSAQPDLIIVKDRLAKDLRTDLLDSNDSCYINEGCVGGLGDRQLIRFSTHIRNIGDQDFVVGRPPTDPSHENAIWEYDQCHEHWHYEGYVQYFLYDQNGNKIPVGNKNGFCLMDSECDNGGFPKFHCTYQGVSAGCGDMYGWSLDCQWIDVTDVPSGIYRLENKVNHKDSPDINGTDEASYANNSASVCMLLSRGANGRHLVELLPDERCNCTDADKDGVCADQDCNDSDPAIPSLPNTLCDDLNPNTINDKIQPDGCTCAGIAVACLDVDKDGICADQDCNDLNAALPALLGTPCDDGNSMTFNDAYLADGCTCQGITPFCIDNDKDGFCVEADCDDTDPFFPTTIGAICDDNNLNTINDRILADGCTCQGIQIPALGKKISCGEISITYGGGAISLIGTINTRYFFKIYDLNNDWREVATCSYNCGFAYTAALPQGCYKVHIYTTNWKLVCDTDITLEESTAGCLDVDKDGVCATIDCDDNNPLLPAILGTSCDDGKATTIKDVIQADGCTCLGQLPNVSATPCAGIFARVSGNTLIVDGQLAPIKVIKLYRIQNGWTLLDQCINDCSVPHIFSNLATGSYWVDIQLYDAEWQKLCFKQLEVTVGIRSF